MTDTVFAGGLNPDGVPLWDWVCPVMETFPNGQEEPCQFVSRGWATIEGAQERGKQHLYEHFEGAPMQDMQDFMRAHGLVPDRHHAFDEEE